MKLVVDMNLSPDWVPVLTNAGWHTVHWSTVGNPRAEDPEVMAWARQQGCVVFTHDLDFGTLLALTKAEGPSVIQVRTQDVTPQASGSLAVNTLRRFEAELERGALIVIDEARARVRVLPFKD
jgi:predicted nuclease of predicted toxin-antitoxin system